MSMVQVNSGTCALKIAVLACLWLDVGMHVFNRHRFARAGQLLFIASVFAVVVLARQVTRRIGRFTACVGLARSCLCYRQRFGVLGHPAHFHVLKRRR
jgi:hypothetical protein